MARAMNFAFLFDRRRKLLRIGYDVTTGALDDSYYDLLASEARMAVFTGIAKGDIPREAWFHLGRKLTCYRGQRTLMSWGGTLFEYLMPSLYMKTHAHTLLAESLLGAVRIQQLYCAERRLPWGVSEAAFRARNGGQYQYQAFGVPVLGAKRRQEEEIVIAPYAGVLALQVDRAAATDNLRQMASRGWIARYGFYESVDYMVDRAGCVVQAFMAHHQGMALMALCNTLRGGVMQERFHAEPMVLATEFLLQERVPALPAAEEEPALPAPAQHPARQALPLLGEPPQATT
jgi:cyclic beta-1,2-glucan synthetase